MREDSPNLGFDNNVPPNRCWVKNIASARHSCS